MIFQLVAATSSSGPASTASRPPTTSRRSSRRAASARARTSSCSTSRHPGAGASGIACGVVRNNYFQPAMSELMQACVEVWESDPAAYHYNPVGYIALGPRCRRAT